MTNPHIAPAPATSSGNTAIAVAAALCLLLGLSGTYWLTHDAPPVRALSASRHVLLQAAAIDAAPIQSGGTSYAAADDADYSAVGFNILGGFYYEPRSQNQTGRQPETLDKKDRDNVPKDIRELNGRKIAVRGYMVPDKVERGEVKGFLLVKDRSLCCFGRMPRMNELVMVTMAGDRSARYINDQPITAYGPLQVGEEYQNGEVVSLYRMEAETVSGPLD